MECMSCELCEVVFNSVIVVNGCIEFLLIVNSVIY